MVLRVLFVGSGITAAIAAAVLRKKCQENVRVVVWDKARGTGGRMSTSRSPHNGTCIADLGAQYITTLPENMAKHKEIYSSLISSSLLEPLHARVEGLKEFPTGTSHFAAPLGMSSLAKHFLSIGAHETHFGRHVSAITQQERKWEVVSQNGDKDSFDIVVLTMPVPQILQLSGTVQDIISKSTIIKQSLSETKYSSRYALALFYDCPLDIAWDVRYLTDSPIFRYIALDNKKRNRPDELTAIVLHTSITFGEENVERSISDVQTLLMKEVESGFPKLPQPTAVKCHKWRYSQVLVPYSGQPGSLTLSQSPLLIAGGDGFAASGLDGCIASAIHLSGQVVDSVNCMAG